MWWSLKRGLHTHISSIEPKRALRKNFNQVLWQLDSHCSLSFPNILFSLRLRFYAHRYGCHPGGIMKYKNLFLIPEHFFTSRNKATNSPKYTSGKLFGFIFLVMPYSTGISFFHSHKCQKLYPIYSAGCKN